MAVMASRAGSAPETDLGVVATAPVTEEAVNQVTPDLPPELISADPSDVPSMDAVIAQPEAELNAGDVPVIEVETESLPSNDGSDDDSTGDDGT
jgi:hypothetical protein